MQDCLTQHWHNLRTETTEWALKHLQVSAGDIWHYTNVFGMTESELLKHANDSPSSYIPAMTMLASVSTLSCFHGPRWNSLSCRRISYVLTCLPLPSCISHSQTDCKLIWLPWQVTPSHLYYLCYSFTHCCYKSHLYTSITCASHSHTAAISHTFTPLLPVLVIHTLLLQVTPLHLYYFHLQ